MNRLNRLKIRKMVRDEIGKAIKIRDDYYDLPTIEGDDAIYKAIKHFKWQCKNSEKGSAEYKIAEKNLKEAQKALQTFGKLDKDLHKVESDLDKVGKSMDRETDENKIKQLQKKDDQLTKKHGDIQKKMNSISKKYHREI